MNRAILTATLVLLAVAGPVAADRSALREQSERVVSAAGLQALRVENARGLIEVRRGAPDRLRLVALKIVRAPESQRARLANQTRVETGIEGGTYVVKVRYPQGEAIHISLWDVFAGAEVPRVEVRLSLEVPEGFRVRVSSASGDLVSSGLAGEQTLETTSGDITLDDARGALKASTTSGDIDASGLATAQLHSVSGDLMIENAGGPLTARTTSGDISVRGARDSLRLDSVSGDLTVDAAPRGIHASTTSGDLTVRDVGGAVRLGTASGEVEVRATPSLTDADVSTVSGSVEFAVAEQPGCALRLQTASGTIEVTLPVRLQQVTRRLVTGTVGQGSAGVSVRSSSGDIHVTSGGK